MTGAVRRISRPDIRFSQYSPRILGRTAISKWHKLVVLRPAVFEGHQWNSYRSAELAELASCATNCAAADPSAGQRCRSRGHSAEPLSATRRQLFELRGLDADALLLTRAVGGYQKSYDLTRTRYLGKIAAGCVTRIRPVRECEDRCGRYRGQPRDDGGCGRRTRRRHPHELHARARERAADPARHSCGRARHAARENEVLAALRGQALRPITFRRRLPKDRDKHTTYRPTRQHKRGSHLSCGA